MKIYQPLLTILLFTNLFSSAAKADTSDIYIPELLKPWTRWVMQRHPELECASMGVVRNCIWPGKLDIIASSNGASFEYKFEVDSKQKVKIPGSSKVWPANLVLTNSFQSQQEIVLQRINGFPFLVVDKGSYKLSGKFSWRQLPKNLNVPDDAAIINLQVDNENQSFAKVDSSGLLWFQNVKQERKTEDKIKIEIFRKIIDGNPFRIVTHLKLDVSGAAREVNFGQVLHDGAVPISINSSLNSRIVNNRLSAEVRSGRHYIEIETVLATPPSSLSIVNNDLPQWPSKETWVWVPNRVLRTVDLQGGNPISAELTSLPAAWQANAALSMTKDSSLVINQVTRGEQTVGANQISLQRNAWLELDGKALTFVDELSGSIKQGWRLEANPDLELQEAKLNNQLSLLTHDVEGKGTGVEVRSNQLQLEAISKVDAPLGDLPVAGWEHDLNSLSMNLNVPPGWQLLWTKGVDNAEGTWIGKWTLLDLFLVIIFSVGIAKLKGAKVGLISLVALVLSHDQVSAPYQLWFHLLIALSLLSVLSEGSLKKYIRWYYYLCGVLLVLNLIPFAVEQIRFAIYPHLGSGDGGSMLPFGGGSIFQLVYDILNQGFGILLLGVILIFALIQLFKKKFKVALGLFVLVGLSSTIFNLLGEYLGSSSYPAGSGAYYQDAMAPQPQQFKRVESKLQKSRGKSDYMPATVPLKEHSAMADVESREFDENIFNQVDPNAVYQIGRAKPGWNWKQYNLSWSGPVQSDQRMSLTLVGPKMHLIISFLRVLLFMMMLLFFFPVLSRKSVAKFLVFTLVSLTSTFNNKALADTLPSDSLLSELENRLVNDVCKENCSIANKVSIQSNNNSGELRIEVQANGESSWPIPGPVDRFYPENVLIDGVVTTALRRDSQGFAWVKIPSGSHLLKVVGQFADENVISLQFVDIPGSVEFSSNDWEAEGISDTYSVGSSIELYRKVATKKQTSEVSPNVLPEWYEVSRNISIGVEWQVVNTATRLGKAERASIVYIPLLDGESVISEHRVQDGNVELNFARGVNTLRWTSRLKPTQRLDIKAEAGSNFTEKWSLFCSVLWRCSVSGLTATSSERAGNYLLSWDPWPGEEMAVEFSKPAAIKGGTLSIQSINTEYTLGERLLRGNLNANIAVTMEKLLEISLPQGSELENVTLDGMNIKLQLVGNKLSVPLKVGQRSLFVSWKSPWEESFIWPVKKMPEVKLNSELSNINVTVNIGEKEWVWAAFGPKWGPASLFWGKLIVILIIAFILGRTNFTPLRIRDWILLSLGLSTLPSLLIAIPVAWFVLLEFKKKKAASYPEQFNLMQVGIVILTFASFAVFYEAVRLGLIFSPEMMITGNNSSASTLRWYLDISNGDIPTPTIISFPIWVWRIVMLAWASWLSFKLLTWLRFGWSAFSEGGLWKKKVAG